MLFALTLGALLLAPNYYAKDLDFDYFNFVNVKCGLHGGYGHAGLIPCCEGGLFFLWADLPHRPPQRTLQRTPDEKTGGDLDCGEEAKHATPAELGAHLLRATPSASSPHTLLRLQKRPELSALRAHA